MPFLGSALGLTAMCSLGWGNLVAFDWNDLPVGREFDCKFLKKVKSPPHVLPTPPPPPRRFSAHCNPVLRGSILLPPCHPTAFARMARWQQVLAFTLFVRNSSRHVYDDRIHFFNYSTYCLCPIRIATHGSTSLLNES